MKQMKWDWELHDYLYFASKVHQKYCDQYYTPVSEIFHNVRENVVGALLPNYDIRSNTANFKYFNELNMDAFSQEGFRYSKFEDLYKRENHYTTINDPHNIGFACFPRFSNKCPQDLKFHSSMICLYKRSPYAPNIPKDSKENRDTYNVCKKEIRLPGIGDGKTSSYKPKTSGNSDSASVNYGSHWSDKKSQSS